MGDAFIVTATEQIAGRLDAKAVRDYLGVAFALRGRRGLDIDPHQGGQPHAADRGLTFPIQSHAPLASAGGVNSIQGPS